MVAFYQHNITAWMDGTEGLSDGEYRAYHVVCQMIYLHNGPIVAHESGIAGRCNQHALAFRTNLKKLIERGKLFVTPDGKIANRKADAELQRIASKRRKPPANPPPTSTQPPPGRAEVRRGSDGGDARNPLKNNTAPLFAEAPEENRTEERSKTDSSAVASATRRDDDFEKFWKAYPRRDGANPKAPALKLFQASVKAGVSADDIIGGAERCAIKDARHIGTPYIPQAVKWLRDRRWLDYVPEIAIVSDRSGFHAKLDSDQYAAWQAEKRKTTPRWGALDRDGGWWFPSEWPPGYVISFKEAAE